MERIMLRLNRLLSSILTRTTLQDFTFQIGLRLLDLYRTG